ncbi:uncharacterized protein LACBIDRAFT_331216 [Laccaria bicolor S238N-H82]|uniref:Predicted protein n=1 Tax=Laccaria bicolor (strain S238N-H82 / ATCC MYA-4686) TaxID=486041 RepID=B0DNU0_LACBS|nr:uncharacterized protein LACBIDRAFT_331216 [Laccaria bicolor S238N-H82]EDR03711.1 predicted protein [Laccaria bicolor S238N-H82]|eukprot:XP_001885564.1 predicted protein [Laccaria bicolor S238N-H82]
MIKLPISILPSMNLEEAFLMQQLGEELDDEEDNNLLEATGTVAMAILSGIELSRQLWSEQRHPSHLYLGWAQLLINPQVGTLWQVLFISLQQIFALIPSTVSRYINFSLPVLLATLRNMEDVKIKWFSHLEQFKECNRLIVAQHPHLTGAFFSACVLSESKYQCSWELA